MLLPRGEPVEARVRVVVERASEGTNGLQRKFTPGGTDLDDASQTWLHDVAPPIINRPGQTPGWRPREPRPSNQPLHLRSESDY